MACNPTVQYNDFTGNGSTTAYTFTFPYDNTTDVQVRLGTYPNYTYPSYTTEYSVDSANPTVINFVNAPTGPIRIFRCTPNAVLPATFQPGSAIRSSDLNNNFNQSLYVTQDASIRSVDAQGVADTAYSQSITAIATANTALSTAQTAEANSIQAVNTANTANTNATNAVNTANTANTNSTAALNNSRESDGSGGFTSAIAKANTAVTTSNAASATANTASTNASAAVTTANTAETNSSAAVTTSNAVQTALANAVLYTPIANVANIPGSPSNEDYIEVQNSNGIETFSPLANLPSGFVGAAGLTVRLKYTTTGSTWSFQNYFANDSETRYLTKNLPVVTGDSTNGSGQITLNCENNSHGIKIKGPPHSAGANYTLTLPNNTGTSGQALTTNGSGVLSFATVDSAFIETPQAITVNKVIAASTNAGMMGPTVAINSGISITVGANSQLTVLN